MGLISLLFGWPLAPVQGVIRLGELIQEQVEAEMRDPAVIRRELEEIDEAADEGVISEEEHAEQMEQVLQKVIEPVDPDPPGPERGAGRR
ncbi:gas vesicle protein GvpG [Nonomuraea lactucae]|uniref:gas vesicle protein GvpG n=1 Tax=Nonomuraea lactucae TaxID=2249762 RepID=UPI000DE231D5|nr:gas vesicle protein GvpG [Nonomuraea lactucae]